MKEHKYLFVCIISILLLFSLSMNTLAAKNELSWYCVRSGNKQPELTFEEKLINKYGGISIDRSVSDSSEKRVIYLTFDAGYENGNVEKIIDVLHEENVTAAFFLLDNIILKNTELVTKMASNGHLICNHTKNHKNLCNSSLKEIKEDIEALERIYYKKTGLKMEKLFRFPEGRYSESAIKYVNELGYTTVFWSFAYDDWDNNRQPDRNKAIKKILSNTHNGAIFLFHPTSTVNADIMKDLIISWKSMGYSFGSLYDICLK